MLDLISGPLAKIALGKLDGIFDEGVSMVTITRKAGSTEGPLPGFELLTYSEECVVIRKATHEKMQADAKTHPWRLTQEENEEYAELLEMAKNGTWISKEDYAEFVKKDRGIAPSRTAKKPSRATSKKKRK